MSAFGRLWDRAPAWRFTVILATATMMVSVVYAPWQGGTPGAAPLTGKYQPPTRAQILGAPRSDVVIVAGRQIPLPSGEWHMIARGSSHDDPPVDSEILIRVQDSRITGIVVSRGTTTPSAAIHKLPYGSLCSSPKALDSAVVQTGNSSRECWGIVSSTPSTDWRVLPTDRLYRFALDRFNEAGLSASSPMIATAWFHADDANWAVNEYMFDPAEDKFAPQDLATWSPQTVGANPAASNYVNRVAAWTRRWVPLLQKGLGGGLSPADLSLAKSADDPS